MKEKIKWFFKIGWIQIECRFHRCEKTSGRQFKRIYINKKTGELKESYHAEPI